MMHQRQGKKHLIQLGPGFVIAATGVGAGDLVAATVGGVQFGTVILWASLLGALLKFVLNEGIARWQLSTETTLISGWIGHFPKVVSGYFLLYLVVWSFVVAAALMASCGIAAHAFFPGLSVMTWGCIHSIAGVLLVVWGRYQLLERLMKVFIGLMFLTVIMNLMLLDLNWKEVFLGLVIPEIPKGGTSLVLGIIGGVGGSVTLLCYGYWLKEKGWNRLELLSVSRIDLGIAYFLTGFFGIAVILLAGQVHPDMLSGNKIVVALADKLGETTGPFGKWIFMVGFWGAVFSSLLGVWNGVPYLFQDFYQSWKKVVPTTSAPGTKAYRYYLLFLAFPPMILLFLDKPIWIIILYAATGAFFMPFLAVMLLIMNNRGKWVRSQRYSLPYNFLLTCSLLLFVYLLADKLIELFS